MSVDPRISGGAPSFVGTETRDLRHVPQTAPLAEVAAAPESEPVLAGLDDELCLENGQVAQAAGAFDVAVRRFVTRCGGAATMWNGDTAQLLGVPLMPAVLEGVTPEQIDAWGTSGDAPMLARILHADPGDPKLSDDLRGRLDSLQDRALRQILGRKARSLDVLVLTLRLGGAERLLGKLEAMVRTGDDLHLRSGALAAITLVSRGTGGIAPKAAVMRDSLKADAARIPSFGAVEYKATIRGTAAAVVRVEAAIAGYRQDVTELAANAAKLGELADTVTHGSEGAAVRVKHVPDLTQGYKELLAAYDLLLGNGDNGLTEDLQYLQALGAHFDDTDLREKVGHLESFRRTLILDRAAFVGSEAKTAVAVADRGNYKGLPTHVGAKDRLALLSQARGDLGATIAGLKAELEAVNAHLASMTDKATGREAFTEHAVAVNGAREHLKVAGKEVLTAVATSEGANRADEATAKNRVADIESAAARFGTTIDALVAQLPDLSDPAKAAATRPRLETLRDEAATGLRRFAELNGPLSKAGGVRPLGAALEATAKMVAGFDFRPGDTGTTFFAQVTALKQLAEESVARMAASGLVRPREQEAVSLFFRHAAKLGNAAVPGAAVGTGPPVPGSPDTAATGPPAPDAEPDAAGQLATLKNPKAPRDVRVAALKALLAPAAGSIPSPESLYETVCKDLRTWGPVLTAIVGDPAAAPALRIGAATVLAMMADRQAGHPAGKLAAQALDTQAAKPGGAFYAREGRLAVAQADRAVDETDLRAILDMGQEPWARLGQSKDLGERLLATHTTLTTMAAALEGEVAALNAAPDAGDPGTQARLTDLKAQRTRLTEALATVDRRLVETAVFFGDEANLPLPEGGNIPSSFHQGLRAELLRTATALVQADPTLKAAGARLPEVGRAFSARTRELQFNSDARVTALQVAATEIAGLNQRTYRLPGGREVTGRELFAFASAGDHTNGTKSAEPTRAAAVAGLQDMQVRTLAILDATVTNLRRHRATPSEIDHVLALRGMVESLDMTKVSSSSHFLELVGGDPVAVLTVLGKAQKATQADPAVRPVERQGLGTLDKATGGLLGQDLAASRSDGYRLGIYDRIGAAIDDLTQATARIQESVLEGGGAAPVSDVPDVIDPGLAAVDGQVETVVKTIRTARTAFVDAVVVQLQQEGKLSSVEAADITSAADLIAVMKGKCLPTAEVEATLDALATLADYANTFKPGHPMVRNVPEGKLAKAIATLQGMRAQGRTGGFVAYLPAFVAKLQALPALVRRDIATNGGVMDRLVGEAIDEVSAQKLARETALAHPDLVIGIVDTGGGTGDRFRVVAYPADAWEAKSAEAVTGRLPNAGQAGYTQSSRVVYVVSAKGMTVDGPSTVDGTTAADGSSVLVEAHRPSMFAGGPAAGYTPRAEGARIAPSEAQAQGFLETALVAAATIMQGYYDTALAQYLQLLGEVDPTTGAALAVPSDKPLLDKLFTMAAADKAHGTHTLEDFMLQAGGYDSHLTAGRDSAKAAAGAVLNFYSQYGDRDEAKLAFSKSEGPTSYKDPASVFNGAFSSIKRHFTGIRNRIDAERREMGRMISQPADDTQKRLFKLLASYPGLREEMVRAAKLPIDAKGLHGRRVPTVGRRGRLRGGDGLCRGDALPGHLGGSQVVRRDGPDHRRQLGRRRHGQCLGDRGRDGRHGRLPGQERSAGGHR